MSKMNKEKAIKLAKKLKALSERGVHGEKNSAKDKLEAVLKTYGLELYQLNENLRVFERTTLNEGSVILERIIKSVNPDAQIVVKQFKTKLIIEAVLSDIEYKEIRQKYKFFWRAYNRERKLLLTSFFNRHYKYFNPIPKPTPPNTPPNRINIKDTLSSTKNTPPPSYSEEKGGRGKPLNLIEEGKVRAMMSALSPLNYDKIPEMQDTDSPSDMEYKTTN